MPATTSRRGPVACQLRRFRAHREEVTQPPAHHDVRTEVGRRHVVSQPWKCQHTQTRQLFQTASTRSLADPLPLLCSMAGEVQHDFASFHDISAVDADGTEVKMSKFRGKTVLVCNVACK